MLLRPSLRCKDGLVFSERSLAGWVRILLTGTLIVAATTLLHISVIIKGFPSARSHADIHWTASTFQNSSCQQQSRPSALSNNSLGIVSKIYVISLPRRTDRRFQMDRLKDALHLAWTYRNAIEANAPVVTTILRQVHVLRSQLMPHPKLGGVHMPNGAIVSVFNWPHDLEDTICSQESIQPSGAELWTGPSSHSFSDLVVPAEIADPYAFTYSPTRTAQGPIASRPTLLACTSGNEVFAAFSPKLPQYRRLTAAKVACWYSHFQTIREIADGNDEAVLILEDDIDIERDVKGRLPVLFNALPSDWDIVYLGHCWSNESRFPSIRNISLRLPSGRTTLSRLHPASSPKCTHAYVLSRVGARRVVAHLRHPPFAYSRAIDQALAWLVQSGRLRAFSIVPPVVVQRKITVSDVISGVGSAWRDELYDGVFGDVDD
ncbi:hypothetical protein BC827DRAFT_1187783 [Russula dissimulans]|nr:hypothetical protein BC827DRAFT_1187783 [Russula dissimulans]